MGIAAQGCFDNAHNCMGGRRGGEGGGEGGYPVDGTLIRGTIGCMDSKPPGTFLF